MSVTPSKLSFRLVATNYIGGTGYYALHIAWLLIVLLFVFQAFQYLVFDGRLVPTMPMTTGSPADTAVSSGVLALIASLLTFGVAVVSLLVVLGLPYLIGSLSRAIPVWLIGQTNRQLNHKTLHRTKQTLVLLVACLSIVALYTPSGTASSNLAFFLTLALCLAAAICFWVQYKTAAYWKIPVSSLF